MAPDYRISALFPRVTEKDVCFGIFSWLAALPLLSKALSLRKRSLKSDRCEAHGLLDFIDSSRVRCML